MRRPSTLRGVRNGRVGPARGTGTQWRAVRDCALAATCTLLVAVVVLSAAVGRASYIWCVPMARAASSCCCHGDLAAPKHHADSADTAANGVTAFRVPCCETRYLENIRRAAAISSDGPKLQLAAWVHVIPVASRMFDVHRSLELHASLPIRAGPRSAKTPQYIVMRTLLI
jgi:hypothetical protein